MSGERASVTVPAHHVIGMDLSFTCTNCGGHTSITPPCIPAKTYPTSEPSEVAETTAGEREAACPWCHYGDPHPTFSTCPASPPAVAASTGTSEDEPNIVQRIVNAWDCCGTCAGGVLARHVADREAAARAEALREAADALDDHTACYCEDGDHLRRSASPGWLRARAAREG